jgi:hypothetical protein
MIGDHHRGSARGSVKLHVIQTVKALAIPPVEPIQEIYPGTPPVHLITPPANALQPPQQERDEKEGARGIVQVHVI